MKKIFKIICITLLIVISFTALLYTKYLSLDIYTWDTDNMILSFDEKQYKSELINHSVDPKLEKRIGKIKGEDFSFMVWSIKGESTDNRIAIKGFMFPTDIYSRIK